MTVPSLLKTSPQDFAATCREVVDQGFELAEIRNNRLQYLPIADKDHFVADCQQNLKKLLEKSPWGSNTALWSAENVRRVGEVARFFGLKVVLRMGGRYSETSPISISGLLLNFNLLALQVDDIETNLQHEMGHFRDYRLLALNFPELWKKLEDGFKYGKIHDELGSPFEQAYIELFRRQIRDPEKLQRFNELAARFFPVTPRGDNDQRYVLVEALRWGEDRNDEGLSKYSFRLMNTYPPRVRAMMIAAYRVSGLWKVHLDYIAKLPGVAERLKSEGKDLSRTKDYQDFEDKIFKNLSAGIEEEIEFFEIAIEAASRYYIQMPPSWANSSI